MLRSLFALVVLLALIAAGIYFWKLAPGGLKPNSFGEVCEKLEDAKTTALVKAALTLNRSLKPYGIAASV